MHPLTLRLPVEILPQPDETTCLDAIYRYWGQDSQLSQKFPARTSWSSVAHLRFFWTVMP